MEGMEILMAAFARGLLEAGVAHACISPGSRSTPLALALLGTEGLRCWSHVDERSGGFFGLGIAKATRRPVVLLSTSGTAAAGFHPAVIEARHAGIPLVILTADRPPELRACGAGQTIDQIKLYGATVKWFFEASAPDATASSVRFFRSLGARAAAIAGASPAGPVHLNVPLGDPLTPAPERLAGASREAAARDPRPRISHTAGRLVPEEAVVQSLADLIAARPEGIIVCGDSGGDRDLAAAVTMLARAAGYPVLAEITSGLRTGPFCSALVMDAYDTLLRVEAFAARHRPALTIQIGAMPTSKALREHLALSGESGGAAAVNASSSKGGSARYILVDPGGDQRDPLHLATEVIRAEPVMLCRALAAMLGEKRSGSSSWLASWREANSRVRAAVQEAVDTLEEPFEGRAARDLALALPPGATLFVGSSMPVRDLDAFLPGKDRDIRVLANRGANGIDGVVSTALGVAAVSDGPTALLVGDLSFLHDLGGLLAARRYGIPLTIVVVNNDGGGIFHFLPQSRQVERFEEFFATPHGLDFAHAADLFGLGHRVIRDPNALLPVVAASLESAECRILEFRTDPKRNVEIHAEIERAASEALRDA